MRTRNRFTIFNIQGFRFIAITTAIFSLAACGGGGGSGDPDPAPNQDPFNMPVGGFQVNVSQPGLATIVSGKVTVPQGAQSLTELSLDAQATVDAATVTVTPAPVKAVQDRAQPFLTGSGTLEIFIDFASNYPTSDVSQACTNGESFGSFSLDINSENDPVVTVTPPIVEATPSVIGMFNSGEVAVCFVVTITQLNGTSVDFQFTDLVLFTVTCDITPEDMNGTWDGGVEGYTCNNSGAECESLSIPAVETGPINLTINQPGSGNFATYSDDGGANYIGFVCGNKFTFNGGIPFDYKEDGVFTLTSPTQGSKSSDWEGFNYLCGGSCSDPVLTKQ